MFGNLGFGEVIMIALLGLVIFGPERLPKAASDAVRMFRQVRAMADSAMTEIKSELPPDLAELDLRSMNPRHLVEKAILGGGGTVSGTVASTELEEHYRDREARRRLDDEELLEGPAPIEGQTTLPI